MHRASDGYPPSLAPDEGGDLSERCRVPVARRVGMGVITSGGVRVARGRERLATEVGRGRRVGDNPRRRVLPAAAKDLVRVRVRGRVGVRVRVKIRVRARVRVWVGVRLGLPTTSSKAACLASLSASSLDTSAVAAPAAPAAPARVAAAAAVMPWASWASCLSSSASALPLALRRSRRMIRRVSAACAWVGVGARARVRGKGEG